MAAINTKSSTEILGDDMKAYETQYENRISGEHAYIVRCDGHSFSKFTNGFHRPFDVNFKKAMIACMNDAVDEFHATTGYTHSDEISLIFPPMPLLDGTTQTSENPEAVQSHAYNGRVCKILSLISSYVSVRFNYHLINLIRDHQNSNVKYNDQFVEKINRMTAHFDSRMLVFPPDKFVDIARHMVWRSLRDCSRNAISTYARQYFSSKEVTGKNSQEMIEMMKLKGFDYDSQVPEDEKIGTYAKKELYEIEAINRATETLEKACRGRIVNKTMRANTSPEFINLLLSKYFD